MNNDAPLINLQNENTKQEKALNIGKKHIHVEKGPAEGVELNVAGFFGGWGGSRFVVVVVYVHEPGEFQEVDEVDEERNETDY